MSNVDMIMLRFRPIAPKPVATGTVSDGSSLEFGDALSRSAKRKRAKNNRGNKRCNQRIRRRKTVPPPVVTLPLLPETPDPKDPPEAKRKNVPVWLSFENRGHNTPAKVVEDPPVTVLGGSVVTVECVTDTWQEEGEGLGLGNRDQERKVKLGEDTCPGFISDGYGRVTWTNEAYREMVGWGGVWLAMKVRVPCPYDGFTCRVRVQFACGKEKTVLSDVWKMDNGDFAWRLDVHAALSLSLAL